MTDGSVRRLFAYPFRIFFLSAAVLAALVVPWWTAAVTGAVPVAMLPAWHAHEMLYGFLAAAIAGFLLTAVCRWTDSDPVSGVPLLGLYALWLLPRLAAAGAPPLLSQLAELAFLPLVILAAARPIVRVRQWRQLPLLAALALFCCCDLAFHASGDPRWLHGGLLLGALLVVLVGSRITPAFSRNWLRQRGGEAADVADPGWLAWPLYAVFLLLLAGEAWIILGAAGPPAALTAVVSLAGAGQLLLAALALRVAAALGLPGWEPTVIASALTWFMAFALYLWYYSSVLMNPRPDGRPG